MHETQSKALKRSKDNQLPFCSNGRVNCPHVPSIKNKARSTFSVTTVWAAAISVTPSFNSLVKCKVLKVNRSVWFFFLLAVTEREDTLFGGLKCSIRCELLRWKDNHVTLFDWLVTSALCSCCLLWMVCAAAGFEARCYGKQANGKQMIPNRSQNCWWACSKHETLQQPYGKHWAAGCSVG